MKRFLLALTLGSLASPAFAQFSEFRNNEQPPSNIDFSKGNASLQISGRISAYYGYRWLKDGQTNLKHNGFAMKDADLDFLGKSSGFTYEFHVSVLDLVNASAVGNTANLSGQNSTNSGFNPATPGVKALYVAYEGEKIPVHVKLGYDKVPFSQGSLNDAYTTPFWNHANLFGGDFYSRRDLGLTLYQSFWKKRVFLYAGAFSGLGENVFEYGADGSGRLEYIARATLAYPAPIKYNAIDERHSPIPTFRVGVNARYTDKTQPTGRSIAADVPDVPGAYGIRMINGKKGVYGADFIMKYKGLSLLGEWDYVDMQPASATDALLAGTSASFNGGHVHAGGYNVGANYDWREARSVFSLNYENLNGNDLIDGHEEWLYAGYAYTLSGFNSVIKAEYYRPLTEDATQNALKWTGQLRIGYQLLF